MSLSHERQCRVLTDRCQCDDDFQKWLSQVDRHLEIEKEQIMDNVRFQQLCLNIICCTVGTDRNILQKLEAHRILPVPSRYQVLIYASALAPGAFSGSRWQYWCSELWFGNGLLQSEWSLECNVPTAYWPISANAAIISAADIRTNCSSFLIMLTRRMTFLTSRTLLRISAMV